jgi:hypothetical protein
MSEIRDGSNIESYLDLGSEGALNWSDVGSLESESEPCESSTCDQFSHPTYTKEVPVFGDMIATEVSTPMVSLETTSVATTMSGLTATVIRFMTNNFDKTRSEDAQVVQDCDDK